MQPRKVTSNFHNFREVLEAYPAINSAISSRLEHDIQSFCDHAIEAKDLSSLHDDMRELLQKAYQVMYHSINECRGERCHSIVVLFYKLLESVDPSVMQRFLDASQNTPELLYQIFER
jgi:hypothetical protein